MLTEREQAAWQKIASENEPATRADLARLAVMLLLVGAALVWIVLG